MRAAIGGPPASRNNVMIANVNKPTAYSPTFSRTSYSGAMDDNLLLYDCAGAPSARRARIFIAEKGRSIARINVDLRAREHLRPEYLAVNPAGLVPALRALDGEIITENAGIAAYLEAIWPEPPLLGKSAIERGRVAQWNARVELEGLLPLAAFLRNSHPAFAGRAIPGVGSFAQIPELIARSRSQIELFIPQLEARLSKHAFLAGPEFSVADITGIIFADFAASAKLLEPKTSGAIHEWSERLRNRRSYRESL
jgi:glutathione S-transferase